LFLFDLLWFFLFFFDKGQRSLRISEEILWQRFCRIDLEKKKKEKRKRTEEEKKN